MNLAVLVAGGLSETLQAAPLVGALTSAAAGDVILAAPPEAAAVAAGFGAVREVVPLSALGAGTPFPTLATGVAALRGRRVDAALVCSDRSRERLLAYLAGCPRRVGPAGGVLDALLTSRVPAGPEENRARVWLQLAELVGVRANGAGSGFGPPEQARTAAERLLVGGGFEDGRLLCALVPGGGYGRGAGGVAAEALRWDVERYAHLANQLGRRHGAGIVILGDEPDRRIVETLLLDLDAEHLDLTGAVSVLEAVAVVQRCDLLVGGDTPLLHAAAAVGTPSIGVFGPTDGRRRGAYGPDHRVVQAVGGDSETASLSRVRVDDVLAGIEGAL